MSYTDVYRADDHKENLDAVSMYKMREAADVVIEEDDQGFYKITKPTDGYNGYKYTDSPALFAQDNPQASVLFLRYAGQTTRVAKIMATAGKGSTIVIGDAFYTRDTNTFEINVSGAGAVAGEVNADLFGKVTKYAELTIPGMIPAGKSVITQINPALAEFASDPDISVTADGYTKKKEYTQADDYSFLIPGVPTDISIKVAHEGVTTKYVIHSDVTYAPVKSEADAAGTNSQKLADLGMEDKVLTP
jgi:hypothetical protein